MENKYYTPDLEEFCVGFEYEFKWKPLKGEWKVLENRHPEDLIESIENFYNKEYRVKYLNIEDIESLGFNNYVSPREYDHTWYYKKSREPKLKVWFNNKIPIVRIYNNYPAIMFQGIIKNKTEFKKLLTQLEI